MLQSNAERFVSVLRFRRYQPTKLQIATLNAIAIKILRLNAAAIARRSAAFPYENCRGLALKLVA